MNADLIRRFSTKQFTVRIDALPEDDLDLSFDDDGSVREALDNERLVAFCVRARVFHKTLGEVASDYLGGCIYESLEDFTQRHGYFADMVHNVCREARKAIASAKSVYVRV
jgi:hypothetical protein